MIISIVTISFNSAATIERTIESVLSQDWPEIEYIIIDGGSKDGTVDIIRKYEDKLTFWSSEKDEGISDAFNKGIQKATGKWICLLNSDDTFMPGTIRYIAENAQKDAEVIHSNVLFRKVNGEEFVKKPNLDYNRLLRVGMTLNHVGMFISKSAYEKYGLYSKEYKCVMDRELVARMYAAGAVFQYLDFTSAVFNLGGESTVNYLKHGLPETTRISRIHGASEWSILMYKIKRYTIVSLSRIKHRFTDWFIKSSTS